MADIVRWIASGCTHSQDETSWLWLSNWILLNLQIESDAVHSSPMIAWAVGKLWMGSPASGQWASVSVVPVDPDDFIEAGWMGTPATLSLSPLLFLSLWLNVILATLSYALHFWFYVHEEETSYLGPFQTS